MKFLKKAFIVNIIFFLFISSIFFRVVNAESTVGTSVVISGAVYPDENGLATLDDASCLLIVDSLERDISVIVKSGCSSPSISFSSLISNGSGNIPAISVRSDNLDRLSLTIPATTVTSSSTDWNGYFKLPIDTTFSLPSVAGKTRTVSTAIELGSSDTNLYFEDALRILFPKDKKKDVGYSDIDTTFSEISSTCKSDSGAGLGVDDACKKAVGSNLVVWTTHLSKFVTFSSVDKESSSDSSSNSDEESTSSSEPSSSETAEEVTETVTIAQEKESDEPEKELQVSDEFKLFDIKFTLENDLLKKASDLVAKTEFISFGNVPTLVDLVYRIENSSGDVVHKERHEVTVETELIETQTFSDLSLEKGKYKIILSTTYGDNIQDDFEQAFEVGGKGVPILVYVITAFIVLAWIVYYSFTSKFRKK